MRMSNQLRLNLCIGAACAAMQLCLSTPAVAQNASPEHAAHWRVDLSDRTLKTALARWSEGAGWQLVWELSVDFPIEARAEIDGSFEDAVGTVVKSMERSNAPIKAVFYRGNKVLRIVDRGVQ
jgi:hypothetical protein